MTYVNTDSFRAIGILFPVLGFIAVVSRFACRYGRKNGLGLDDWLCLPALLLIAAMGGICIYGANSGGLGTHTPPPDAVDPADATAFENSIVLCLKLEAIFWWFKIPAIAIIKLIVLLFYSRIFTGRTFTFWNRIIGVGVITWAVTFLFAQIFACGTHIDLEWDSFSTLTTKCVKTFPLMAVNAFLDVFLDIVILSFPHFWVWKLQMPTSQKIKVTMTFLLGGFAVGAGLVRVVVVFAVIVYSNGDLTTVLGLAGSDIVGVASLLVFWSYVEVGVALVACCLPTMRAAFEMVNIKSTFNTLRSRTSTLFSKSTNSFKRLDKRSEASYNFGATDMAAGQSSSDQSSHQQRSQSDYVGNGIKGQYSAQIGDPVSIAVEGA